MTSRRYARLIFTSALRRRALALAALLWPAIAAGQSARTGDAVMRAVPSSPASAGVLRLKEELLRRVNVAAAPYKVRDVLLKEMIVQ